MAERGATPSPRIQTAVRNEATSALTLVQLALVLDAMVLRVVRVHQIADRSFLHPTIRDVEVQPPDA